MPKRIEVQVGERFGRWTITGWAPSTKWDRIANVSCDCGTRGTATLKHLRQGRSTSCGCFRAEVSRASRLRHGETDSKGGATAEYRTWQAMKTRCLNPRSRGYAFYGARGITVCERWLHSFENFLADMGRRPSAKHSIERVDNDAGYSPSNCRWATHAEQLANRRPYKNARAR
jgi:hypothetical protein